MKKLLTVLAAVLLSVAAFAQLTPSQLVTWTPSVENVDGDLYRVVFTGKVAQGYHTYTLADEFSATEIMDPALRLRSSTSSVIRQNIITMKSSLLRTSKLMVERLLSPVPSSQTLVQAVPARLNITTLT